MKLLVTGGLGFIGSNFILNALSKDENVSIVNIDDKLFGSNTLSLEKIKDSKRYEFVKANITNERVILIVSFLVG